MAETAQKSGGARSTAAIKATTLDQYLTGRAERPRTKSDLPKEIFGEPFHEALVHEAARADLAARSSVWIRTWLKSRPNGPSRMVRVAGSTGRPGVLTTSPTAK